MPHNIAMLRELQEKVRAAPKGSPELDEDIHEAMGGCAHRETKYYCIEDGNSFDSGHTCVRCGVDTYGNRDVQPYTSSIDAAVTLAERLLPGWSLRMSYSEGLKYPNVGMARSYPTNLAVTVEHSAMPLAIIDAILSALIAAEAPAEGERR